jgi:3-methyladenine DNA glycosylase AlkD
MKVIEKELFKHQDLKYKDFSSKSIPNLDKDKIIGVRVPILREYAKKINKDFNLRNEFINDLPHKYNEENLLHAFLISLNKNIDDTINELKTFLPYIDNWAVCDTINPKVFNKSLDFLYYFIESCIQDNREYTIRFGVVSLLKYYLNDSKYIKNNNKLVLSIKYDSYYVNMAIAWYLSFALIKQYDETIKLFECSKIKNKWIHNKAIQKAIESYRIDENIKKYLKSLKRM